MARFIEDSLRPNDGKKFERVQAFQPEPKSAAESVKHF
jgi:ribosomal protein S16